MIHPLLVVLGYSEAAMFLSGPEGAPVAAVISIHGHREFTVDAPQVPHRLTLQFDDVDVPDPSDQESLLRSWTQRKWSEEIGRPLVPPTIEDAKAIIEFADAVRTLDGAVLCQCQAGISRSPAAALVCLAAWTEKGNEQYCVDHLRAIRPSAMPHRGLVAFGDQLLAREGRLLRAVKGSGG